MLGGLVVFSAANDPVNTTGVIAITYKLRTANLYLIGVSLNQPSIRSRELSTRFFQMGGSVEVKPLAAMCKSLPQNLQTIASV
jgi:hypothetical protein